MRKILVEWPKPLPSLIASVDCEKGICVAVALLENEEFALNTYAYISVLKGAVDIFGGRIEAYASNGQFLEVQHHEQSATPAIVGHLSPASELDGACHSCGGYCESIASLCQLSRHHDCVLLLRKHLVSHCSPIEAICHSPSTSSLLVPEIWRSIYDEVVHSQRECEASHANVMLMGGVGAGKSTLCLWLANMLISRELESTEGAVAILDTDPGRPMFGVPGCVSLRLMTKPHFSLYDDAGPTLVRSIFIGDISPESGPMTYLAAIDSLLTTLSRLRKISDMDCQRCEIKSPIPLLINTCGWISGCGWQLLDAIGALSQTKLLFVVGAEESSALPTLPETSSLPRVIQGVKSTFSSVIDVPYLADQEKNMVQIVPVPTANQTVEKSGHHSKCKLRLARVMQHLCRRTQSKAALDRKWDRLQVLHIGMDDKLHFNVLTDSLAWKTPNYLQYNINLMFQGALVALEGRPNNHCAFFDFICLAVVTSINWEQRSVVLAIPAEQNLVLPAEKRLTLASALLNSDSLQRCTEWAVGEKSGFTKPKPRISDPHVKKVHKLLKSTRLRHRVRI